MLQLSTLCKNYFLYLKKMWTLVLISDIQLLWSSASRNPILCLGFSFILFKIIFPLSHFSGKLQIFFSISLKTLDHLSLHYLSFFGWRIDSKFQTKNLPINRSSTVQWFVLQDWGLSPVLYRTENLSMKVVVILSGSLKNFKNCRHNHFNSTKDCSNLWSQIFK